MLSETFLEATYKPNHILPQEVHYQGRVTLQPGDQEVTAVAVSHKIYAVTKTSLITESDKSDKVNFNP